MVHREIPREIEPEALTPTEVEAITRAVFVRGDPQPCELMLVFGASRVSGNWRRAASLIRSGFAKRVLVTGGMPYGEDEALPEAVGIRSDLIELGVPYGSIVVEECSRNSLENVTLSHDLLLGAGAMPASILFYCKSHHAGRVRRTLCKHLPHIPLSHAGYDATYAGVTVRESDWHTNPLATARVLGEYERIRRYSARGDIA
jgi:uncharacterized SAM-binding protein YcdF (DUF218 family)